jgi:hypothetical protein
VKAIRALAHVERHLEMLVEGGFLRLFRSRLQPVDLAKRLLRAMEEHQTLGVGRTLVPNDYAIRLAEPDYQAFAPLRGTLERELAGFVAHTAVEQGWSFVAPPSVRLECAPAFRPGQVQVQARLREREAPPGGPAGAQVQAHELAATRRLPAIGYAADRADLAGGVSTLALDGAGMHVRLPLPAGASIRVGRDLANDVVLAHPSVSRHHARLTRTPRGLSVEDLGSSNGTWHNARRIQRSQVASGDELTFGAVALRVHISQEVAAQPRATHAPRRRGPG